MTRLTVAEWVLPGHPDKLCDAVADRLLGEMVRIDRRVLADRLPLAMILQIHDELLFECPESFREEALELVRREMEAAVELSVPLRVSVESAPSWGGMH